VKLSYQKDTKRLVLRPLKKSDFKNWLTASCKVSPPMNCWDFGPLPLEKMKELKTYFYKTLVSFHHNHIKQDTGYYFGVFEKKSGDYIGTCTLMEITRSYFQNGNLGYRLLNIHWGKGYGTEMLKALIQIAFTELNLHRVVSIIEPINHRSIKLVKAVGLRREGLSRKRYFLKEKWRDMVVYAITKEDF